MRHARREFLAGASLAAAGAWALRPASMPGDVDSDHDRSRLTVVVDESLADSRAFALRARMQGARIVPSRNEIGMLWFERLLPAASRGDALAGLTSHADAFLLTRFALASGMRVTRRPLGAHALVAWRIERDA